MPASVPPTEEKYSGGLGPSNVELQQRKELLRTTKELQVKTKELDAEKMKNKKLEQQLIELHSKLTMLDGEEAFMRTARQTSAIATARKITDHQEDDIRLISRRLIYEERRGKNLEVEARTARKEADALKASLEEAQAQNHRLRAELGVMTQSHRFGHGRGSSLREAARRNDVATVEQLLTDGADPNQDEDGEGRTAIFWAAQCGAVESIKALAARGANVRQRASQDAKAWRWRLDDPLTTACQCGQPEACRTLLEAGALVDINEHCQYQQDDNQWYLCTPLLAACVAGQAEVVKVLLEFDATLSVLRDDGGGPVHCAVRADYGGGHTEVVKILADKKADLNLKDNDGWTPLLHAINLQCIDCVRVLIRSGASLETALEGRADAATQSYASQDLVDAVTSDDIGLVCALLEAGRDVNVPKCEEEAKNHTAAGLVSFTPLCQALKLRRRSCTDLLMGAKADVNCRSISFDGSTEDAFVTPLTIAAESGDAPLVQRLLAEGADVHMEAKPESGFTALHAAVSAGQETAAMTLVKAGGRLDGSAESVGTPLEIAQAKDANFYDKLISATR